MKREDLTKLGLTEENVTEVLDLYHTEVDPIRADLTKSQDDLKAATDAKTAQEKTIKDLQKDLEGLKNEDVGGLKQKITDLNAEIEKQKGDLEAQLKALAEKVNQIKLSRFTLLLLPRYRCQALRRTSRQLPHVQS